MALGCIMVILGIIGAFLPVMPTTIFLILAAWFFGRSSPKLEARLLAHPQFGPILIQWQERGAISPRAKFYSCVGMSVGYLFFWYSAKPSLLLAVIVGLIIAASALYVLTRPSA